MSTFHKVVLSLVVMASFFAGGCKKSEPAMEQPMMDQPSVASEQAPVAPVEAPATQAPAENQK